MQQTRPPFIATSACLLTCMLCATALAGAPRREALVAEHAALTKQVESLGGFDGWSAKLQPWRDEAKAAIKQKWPWPAKEDFVFQGKAIRVAMPDEIQPKKGSQQPRDVLIDLDRQLRSRGIGFMVVIIPDKLAVYPDYLCPKAGADVPVTLAVTRLQLELLEADVDVVDLYKPFRKLRAKLGEDTPIYYDRDSHWRNIAAKEAGRIIAERLEPYGFGPVEGEKQYEIREHERSDGAKADKVWRVYTTDGKAYRNRDDALVLMTGDSFSMYNMHLHGHLPAHVGYQINQPLAYVYREGLAADVPVELAKRQRGDKLLEGKKVVVMTFNARMFSAQVWRMADIFEDGAADTLKLEDAAATGKITAVSEGPKTDAPYPHYISKWIVSDLKDAEGEAIGDGEAIVHVMTMQDRRLLPTTKFKAGDAVSLKLTSWSLVEDKHCTLATAVLDDLEAELNLPHVWTSHAATVGE